MKSYIEGYTACDKRLGNLAASISRANTEPLRDSLEAVASEGWAEWMTALSSAEPMDDTVNDTVVELPEWEGDELVIKAHGENALFVEFGTGVHKNYETKYGRSYGYYPSSWSAGPLGKGWLVGAKRARFKGRWILPKGVIPENRSGAVYRKTVKRTWMTKKYGMRTRYYTYERSTPFFYWAEGHKPVNGMYRAMKRMQSREVMNKFAVFFEVLSK